MGSHNQFDYYATFLNRSNHHPSTVPIDGISYHQYVNGEGALPVLASQYFDQMDAFVVSASALHLALVCSFIFYRCLLQSEVATIEGIRQSFEPSTGPVSSFINEIGCAASIATTMQKDFFLVCAASYAYLFARAAPLQVRCLETLYVFISTPFAVFLPTR